MRFLDSCKIWVQGGNGGNGCLVLPNEEGLVGGKGGRGGNIVAVATANLTTLIDYRYQQHFSGGNGAHGQGSDCHGGHGKDLLIPIPLGTQIYSDEDNQLLVDLVEPGQKFTLCRGGVGGKGGLLAVRKDMRDGQYNAGEKGEGKWLRLQLKLIADIGVVGMPNAGKSTFITTISRAKSKIASYPFTTISPVLATVKYKDKQMTFADIPGLIEDSHLGKGLGDYFLRHIERCAMLIHLIDANSDDLLANYKLIEKELALYGEDLSKKKTVIAISKTDLVDPSEVAKKQQELETYTQKQVVLLSSFSKQGIENLLQLATAEYSKLHSGW